MAAEAEAAREARAKIVRANGEQKATTALKEAANVLSDSPSALQLRYLQVSALHYIAKLYGVVVQNPESESVEMNHYYRTLYFADSEQHWERKKHNHHLPRANRHSVKFYQAAQLFIVVIIVCFGRQTQQEKLEQKK